MSTSYSIDVKDAMKEMLRSLGEWGVRPSKNQSHLNFQHKALHAAASYSKTGTACSIGELQDRAKNLFRLPSERLKAIEVVLEDLLDVEDDYEFIDAQDALGLAWPPYYQRFDRFTGEETYQLNEKNFPRKKYRGDDLDPLRRFTAKCLTPDEWFFAILNDRDHLEGYIYEAVVAQYMQCSMSCVSCYHRHCLRWNGGFETISSWADVVCVSCLASYEIKSLRNEEKIDRSLHFNEFRGGSFRTFYQHPAEGDRYLVVVSRAPSLSRVEKCLAHRVTLAKIKQVVPRLCPESFVTSDAKYVRIQTKVSVDTKTLKKSWCWIPTFPKEDLMPLVERVFDERFGDGTWSRFSNPKSYTCRLPKSTEKAESSVLATDVSVEAIRKALESQSITDAWDL